ncbi:Hypothetical protein NTJ_03426 [Nesidiocoris tenuis]|uniref:Uncharacterized protein n=1 Tax=Nesidiocoris tenuis TaxID=355587 RepID=A0ABN7AEZ6_9HEMI|nr:Hypothetical protein NTJ_03426 [Nesidiocoris tenuis]
MLDKVYVGAILPIAVLRRTSQDNVGFATAKLPLSINQPFWPSTQPTKHGRTVFSSLLPKTIADLKSIKYMPVLKLAPHSNPVDVFKRRLGDERPSLPSPTDGAGADLKFGVETSPSMSPASAPTPNLIEPNWIGHKLVRHLQHSLEDVTGHYGKRNSGKLIGSRMIISKADDAISLKSGGESKISHDIPRSRNKMNKRDLTFLTKQDNTESFNSKSDNDADNYIKIESIHAQNDSLESPRQNQHMVPSWTTIQYNRRPVINTPWMKDTQGVAMNTVNNVNGAMLELSDTDIQRETAKANLVLVQRMAELVLAEKDKVKAEMSRVQTDLERLASERDRNLIEIQKLDMEREMYEAKLLSGTARGELFKKSLLTAPSKVERPGSALDTIS